MKNKISMPVYEACHYFFPRLLFLRSTHAPQIHWGDIVNVLYNFPEDNLDLSTTEFWDTWMQRWRALGDDYCAQAEKINFIAGKKRLWRSAAACYHWAEFMYFSDASVKTNLRQKIKIFFKKSLGANTLFIKYGEITHETISIPYYLIYPQKISTYSTTYPCVILSNGLDSVTEVEIFSFAEQFLSSGIAVLLFDGPGQGINLGHSPLAINFESVVEKLIEELLKQPAINQHKLGFFGVSFGGYIALRVAQHISHYFKCIINLSGGPYISPFEHLPRRLKEDFKFAFMENCNDKMRKIFERLTLTNFTKCKTDILSIHGALDDIFPLKAVKEMDCLLGNKHTLIVYDNEAHVCLNYINQYSVQIVEWTKSKLF